MAERSLPPVSLHSWLNQVNEDPEIPTEFKNGAQDRLKPSSASFSSGSTLKATESLYLRVVWSRYKEVKSLGHLMVDDPTTGYTGYVSTENNAMASSIFNAKRSLWQSHFEELQLREAERISYQTQISEPSDGMDVPRNSLRPELNLFFSVIYWQVLSMSRHIDEAPSDDELRRESSISKPGPDPGPEPPTMPSLLAVNRPITPQKSLKQQTPTPGIHDTPEVSSYHPARGGQFNEAAADENYVNMALIELLISITLSVGVDLSSMDWLSKRLPFKLVEQMTTTNSTTGEVETRVRKLMEARVDGYLCRRASPSETALNTEALAILEAKPYTRSSALASIRRQEGAEMACWISQAGMSKTGLLRTSTSGRKRRLMVSQNRHEIYIIVAEYGAGFEQHIFPSSSTVGGTVKPQQKSGKPGSSNTGSSTHAGSTSAGSDSTADQRDPRLLAGSPSYIRRVQMKSIEVAAGHRSRKPQPTQAKSATRKSPRADDKWVPDAGDFLVMHEFGPFITTDAGHMEVFIRRIIAFMLQLRGPQDRFVPVRPGPKFLLQRGQVGLPRPNEASSRPWRNLKKAHSRPAMAEKLKQD